MLISPKVGPLPVSKATAIKPFTWAYNRGDNSKVPNYTADGRELTKFKQAIGNSIADITLDILGTV